MTEYTIFGYQSNELQIIAICPELINAVTVRQAMEHQDLYREVEWIAGEYMKPDELVQLYPVFRHPRMAV